MLDEYSDQEVWIRRADVMTSSDLHLVVGCWPVSEVSWTEPKAEEGPDVWRPRFDVRGRILAATDMEKRWYRGYQVYISDGVFVLAKQDGALNVTLTPTFVLDPAAMAVRIIVDHHLGAPGQRPYRWHSRSSLIRCPVVPVVDMRRSLADQ